MTAWPRSHWPNLEAIFWRFHPYQLPTLSVSEFSLKSSLLLLWQTVPNFFNVNQWAAFLRTTWVKKTFFLLQSPFLLLHYAGIPEHYIPCFLKFKPHMVMCQRNRRKICKAWKMLWHNFSGPQFWVKLKKKAYVKMAGSNIFRIIFIIFIFFSSQTNSIVCWSINWKINKGERFSMYYSVLHSSLF